MPLPTAFETAKVHHASLLWRTGYWYAVCRNCTSEWPVPLTRAGKPVGSDWWLCPVLLCNLTGQLAKRYLRRMDCDELVPEGVTRAACVVAVAGDERRREHVRLRPEKEPLPRGREARLREQKRRAREVERWIEEQDCLALKEAGLSADLPVQPQGAPGPPVLADEVEADLLADLLNDR